MRWLHGGATGHKSRGEKKMKKNTVKTELIFWDWADQIPVDELNAAMKKVFDGKNCPVVTQVGDVLDDNNWLVVSSVKISAKEAQRLYEVEACLDGLDELED